MIGWKGVLEVEDEAQGRLIGALLNEALGQHETGEAARRRPIARPSPGERESSYGEAFLWISRRVEILTSVGMTTNDA